MPLLSRYFFLAFSRSSVDLDVSCITLYKSCSIVLLSLSCIPCTIKSLSWSDPYMYLTTDMNQLSGICICFSFATISHSPILLSKLNLIDLKQRTAAKFRSMVFAPDPGHSPTGFQFVYKNLCVTTYLLATPVLVHTSSIFATFVTLCCISSLIVPGLHLPNLDLCMFSCPHIEQFHVFLVRLVLFARLLNLAQMYPCLQHCLALVFLLYLSLY